MQPELLNSMIENVCLGVGNVAPWKAHALHTCDLGSIVGITI